MNDSDSKYYNDTDMENAIIGVSLVYSECVDDILMYGVDETWFRGMNRLIWSCIKEVNANGNIVDSLSVGDALSKRDGFNKNMILHLVECVSEIATKQHLETWLKIFSEQVALRKQEIIISQAQKMLQDRRVDSNEISEYIQKEISCVEDQTIQEEKTLTESYKSIASDFMDGTPPVIIYTGFDNIDNVLPMHLGEWTIVGGDSGLGKTSLIMGIASYVNYKQCYPVLFFSLEMSVKQLSMRCLSANSRISLRDIRDKKVSPEYLIQVMEELQSDTFFMEDSVFDIDQVESYSRRYCKKYGVKLIIIDYLQLLHSLSGSSKKREEVLSDAGVRIKKLCKATNTHIIAVSSLDENWGGRYGSSIYPDKHNLAYAKSLHYHADNIMLLYRKEDDSERVVRINVDKSRSDKVNHNIPMGWNGATTRFTDRIPHVD